MSERQGTKNYESSNLEVTIKEELNLCDCEMNKVSDFDVDELKPQKYKRLHKNLSESYHESETSDYETSDSEEDNFDDSLAICELSEAVVSTESDTETKDESFLPISKNQRKLCKNKLQKKQATGRSKGKTPVNEKLKCEFCKKACQSSRSLEVHWKKAHPNEKPFSCSSCEERFMSKKELRHHKYSAHPRAEKWHLCQFCEKSFNRRFNLLLHERTHTGEKPYVCDQCGKGFSLSTSLRRHAEVHLTEEDKGSFKCEICNKEFATELRRKRHYITHKTERDHPCEICGKTFTQTANLNIHMKTHLSHRDFICPYCGNAFARSADLKKHLKRAKNSTSSRLRCKLCDMNFPCHGALSTHKATHRQYVVKKIFECTACSKKFPSRRDLSRHSMTHIDYEDLPFQCSECLKRFGRKDTYRNHLKNIHSIVNVTDSGSNKKETEKTATLPEGGVANECVNRISDNMCNVTNGYVMLNSAGNSNGELFDEKSVSVFPLRFDGYDLYSANMSNIGC